MSTVLSEAERSVILDAELFRYTGAGFRVVNRTATTAQLFAPKTFSFGWAFLWFLLCGFGVLIYVFWYLGKSDATLYLSIDESGQTQMSGRGLDIAATRRACRVCGHISRSAIRLCKRCGAELPAV